MDLKQLPKTNNPLVVRTNFENQQAWKTVCKQIRAPVPAPGDTFYAYVQFLEDVAFGVSALKNFWRVYPATTITPFYLLSITLRSVIRSFQSLSSTCAELTVAISVRSRDRFRPLKIIYRYPIWISLNSRLQLTKMEYFEVFQLLKRYPSEKRWG
jgi:hypothetical protein